MECDISVISNQYLLLIYDRHQPRALQLLRGSSVRVIDVEEKDDRFHF